MIKLENVETIGWEAAIRGMRNPMNSWEKSDTCFRNVSCSICPNHSPGTAHCDMTKHYELCAVHRIGPNDLDLMMRLANAGPVHGKFRRMITVYVDITAPLYWWKEFDTYKVGTVANSCSTMHKIAEKEFTMDDFSHEHICIRQSTDILKETIEALNVFRDVYLNGGVLRYENGNMKCFGKKDKDIWWQMIQLLPSSYNQKRTVMMNYEVLANIYKYRKNHKLDEWVEFCKWIETLPYSEIITGGTDE